MGRPRLTTIRAMCRCGYPFDPDLAYDRTGPWRGRRARRFCSQRCARSWPAKDSALARRQARAREHLAAWERAGQLTLW